VPLSCDPCIRLANCSCSAACAQHDNIRSTILAWSGDVRASLDAIASVPLHRNQTEMERTRCCLMMANASVRLATSVTSRACNVCCITAIAAPPTSTDTSVVYASAFAWNIHQ